MNINKLKKGMIIKNYKELCKLLEVKVSAGSSKKAQLKELNRLIKYKKEGQKFIIVEKYSTPKEKEDGRKNNKGGNNIGHKKYIDILTDKELRDEFDGYYVYLHKMNERIVYVGKGSKRRCVSMSGRMYSKDNITKIEIVKRFEDEYEALKYEESLINHYKELGMCEYNDVVYRYGKINTEETKEYNFNRKIEKELEKMFKYAI